MTHVQFVSKPKAPAMQGMFHPLVVHPISRAVANRISYKKHLHHSKYSYPFVYSNKITLEYNHEMEARYALGQRELYALLNCMHGAKSSPLAATHLK
jgi:hypothetical protein